MLFSRPLQSQRAAPQLPEPHLTEQKACSRNSQRLHSQTQAQLVSYTYWTHVEDMLKTYRTHARAMLEIYQTHAGDMLQTVPTHAGDVLLTYQTHAWDILETYQTHAGTVIIDNDKMMANQVKDRAARVCRCI